MGADPIYALDASKRPETRLVDCPQGESRHN